MDFTVSLSKAHNLSPFQILKEDKDDVIMLINYFIEKGQQEEETKPKPTSKDDGFWDF